MLWRIGVSKKRVTGNGNTHNVVRAHGDASPAVAIGYGIRPY